MYIKVEALVKEIPQRLRRLLHAYPPHIQYHWVFAGFRDNIHSITQILALAGQIANNVEAAKYGESLLTPTSRTTYLSGPFSTYSKHQGVAVYDDKSKAKFRHAVMAHGKDKSFAQRYKEDWKGSRVPLEKACSFAKAYPFEKPILPEKGGWDGVFDKDLSMLIGIGFDPEGDNSCMTKTSGGLFVWSERTMTPLENSGVEGTLESKQLRFVCYMFQLMYHLMMDINYAISDGLPSQQFIGPIKSNN